MPIRNGDEYLVPDGLAGSPGLPFSTNGSTGFFMKSDGSIGMSVGGVEVAAITSHGLAGGLLMQSCLFTSLGAGTYTGTLALPANSRIIDIGVDGQVQWDAATSALMTVGDAGSANGFFLSTNLKATDLLAGEINNIEHPGGLAGAYIASEQRVLFSAAARNVIGVVTQVGTGTAGRTRLYVVYAVEVPLAPVKT